MYGILGLHLAQTEYRLFHVLQVLQSINAIHFYGAPSNVKILSSMPSVVSKNTRRIWCLFKIDFTNFYKNCLNENVRNLKILISL